MTSDIDFDESLDTWWFPKKDAELPTEWDTLEDDERDDFGSRPEEIRLERGKA
jgi:hypothetical protein